MKITQQMVQDLVWRLQDALPEIEIGFKDESRWMKFIGFICKPFNPNFMATTLAWYPKIWFPSRASYEANPGRTARTLAHEAVHLWDTWRDGPFWFRWSYSLPQIVAVPMLVGFVIGDALCATFGEAPPWWVYLAQLLLLVLAVLPWSAPRRCAYELRGYAMSVLLHRCLHGASSAESYTDQIVDIMTSRTYYSMAKQGDRAELKAALLQGRTAYAVQFVVMAWVQAHGLSHKVE